MTNSGLEEARNEWNVGSACTFFFSVTGCQYSFSFFSFMWTGLLGPGWGKRARCCWPFSDWIGFSKCFSQGSNSAFTRCDGFGSELPGGPAFTATSVFTFPVGHYMVAGGPTRRSLDVAGRLTGNHSRVHMNFQTSYGAALAPGNI